MRSHPEVLREPGTFQSYVNQIADLGVLGIRPEDTVADVGAATGAFEFRLLQERIPFRLLYAVDIDQRSLDFLDFGLRLVDLPGAGRIRTVRSPGDSVNLPPASLDVLLVISTPIGVPEPGKDAGSFVVEPSDLRCMASMREALKPGGRLHVLFQHDTWVDLVRANYVGAGLEFVRQQGTPGHHHLEFRRPPAGT